MSLERRLNRRRFIGLSVALAGAALLAGCGEDKVGDNADSFTSHKEKLEDNSVLRDKPVKNEKSDVTIKHPARQGEEPFAPLEAGQDFVLGEGKELVLYDPNKGGFLGTKFYFYNYTWTDGTEGIRVTHPDINVFKTQEDPHELLLSKANDPEIDGNYILFSHNADQWAYHIAREIEQQTNISRIVLTQVNPIASPATPTV